MAASDESGDIQFGGPATYRIVVQGVPDEAWSDRLAGLTASVNRVAGSTPRTTLLGAILDQAELTGVFQTLCGLHLPILSTEKVGDS